MRMDAELKNFLRCTAAKMVRSDNGPDMLTMMQDFEESVTNNDFLLLLNAADQYHMHIPAALLKGIKLAFCTGCEDALDNLVSGNATKKDACDVIRFYRDIVKDLYDSRRINAQMYCDILDIYNQNVNFIKNF